MERKSTLEYGFPLELNRLKRMCGINRKSPKYEKWYGGGFGNELLFGARAKFMD